MIIAKTNTYGLDKEIKKLQTFINGRLSSEQEWGDSSIGWEGTVNIYGLLQKTERENGTILEAWTGTDTNKKEYTQVFINDNITASIGFVEVGTRSIIGVKSTTIDCIVSMLLNKAYPNEAERQDEYAIMKFERVLNEYNGNIELTELRKGINDVFSGYYTGNIKHRDMHPWLVFSLRMNIEYYDSTKCN